MTKPHFVRDEISEVAAIFGVTPEQIMSRNRSAKVYTARCAIINLLDQRGWSSTRIGAALNRHHTSILHSLGRLNKPAVR